MGLIANVSVLPSIEQLEERTLGESNSDLKLKSGEIWNKKVSITATADHIKDFSVSPDKDYLVYVVDLMKPHI